MFQTTNQYITTIPSCEISGLPSPAEDFPMETLLGSRAKTTEQAPRPNGRGFTYAAAGREMLVALGKKWRNSTVLGRFNE